MAAGKRSFILYADYLEMVSKLTDAKAGKLFKLILEYVNDRDPKTDELLLQIAFEPIKQNLKRDLKKWEGEKEDRSESGKLGNLKRWNKDLYDRVVSGEITLEASQSIAKHRKATKGIANVAVNETVTVNDNVNVINTISENEILATVEFCSITLHRKYDSKRVSELWKAFLIQNGKESYLKNGERIKHFRNWIKTQPYEQIKREHQSSSAPLKRGNEI